MLSAAVPLRVIPGLDVRNVVPEAGELIAIDGVTASEITVSDADAWLPAASLAVTVITLAPPCSAMPAILQEVVPPAVPLPQRSHAQVTSVTPTLPDAMPETFTAELVV